MSAACSEFILQIFHTEFNVAQSTDVSSRQAAAEKKEPRNVSSTIRSKRELFYAFYIQKTWYKTSNAFVL